MPMENLFGGMAPRGLMLLAQLFKEPT